jgi:hypothetical protein
VPNVGARSFFRLTNAGSPEATDESPGEEGRRFGALAGDGLGRKCDPCNGTIIFARKNSEKDTGLCDYRLTNYLKYNVLS